MATFSEGNPYNYYFITYQIDFFSIWVFFHNHSRFTGQQGKAETITLTLLYHFHPFHRHFQPDDYCRELTTAHSQQPNSNRKALVSESKSLTTKFILGKVVPKECIFSNLVTTVVFHMALHHFLIPHDRKTLLLLSSSGVPFF